MRDELFLMTLGAQKPGGMRLICHRERTKWPETLQTDEGLAVKLTVKPEVATALRTAEFPTVISAGCVKLMVCAVSWGEGVGEVETPPPPANAH